MQISGTITANAVANKVASGKDVVNFDVAINEGYKTKEGEYKERTQFIRCAIWNRPAIVNILTKGTGVTVTGWLEPRAWIDNATGIAKAGLNLTANKVDVIGKIVKETPQPAAEAMPVSDTPSDDLPF
jgi:single-strand DNA-binding protein